jgi:two-component system chemotaxis response regulator CheB
MTTTNLRLRQLVSAVVIGTSAGGVDALSTILPAIPEGSAVPVFIVLHLTRERPSLLVEIFGPKCQVPVREATDKEPVEPGVVYFAPPDYHLLIERGARRDAAQLALSVDDVVNYSRPSIDVLFESAADIYAERLLGIILTGASHDGAAGLDAVRRAGGWTVVQQPDSAYAPIMVEAALTTSPEHTVLSLTGIADVLRQLDRRSVA